MCGPNPHIDFDEEATEAREDYIRPLGVAQAEGIADPAISFDANNATNRAAADIFGTLGIYGIRESEALVEGGYESPVHFFREVLRRVEKHVANVEAQSRREADTLAGAHPLIRALRSLRGR